MTRKQIIYPENWPACHDEPQISAQIAVSCPFSLMTEGAKRKVKAPILKALARVS